MISSELEYYWISLSFLLLLACNCVITTLFLFLFSFLFLNYYFYLKLLLIMGFQKSLESKIGGICIYSALQRSVTLHNLIVIRSHYPSCCCSCVIRTPFLSFTFYFFSYLKLLVIMAFQKDFI
ncbi:hypothetical protein HN873_029451 [Arachis hypogaea]